MSGEQILLRFFGNQLIGLVLELELAKLAR